MGQWFFLNVRHWKKEWPESESLFLQLFVVQRLFQDITLRRDNSLRLKQLVKYPCCDRKKEFSLQFCSIILFCNSENQKLSCSKEKNTTTLVLPEIFSSNFSNLSTFGPSKHRTYVMVLTWYDIWHIPICDNPVEVYVEPWRHVVLLVFQVFSSKKYLDTLMGFHD